MTNKSTPNQVLCKKTKYVTIWSRIVFALLLAVMLPGLVSAQTPHISANNLEDDNYNTVTNFGTVCVGSNSLVRQIVLSGTNLTSGSLGVNTTSPVANMGFSLTNGGPYSSSLTLTSSNSSWSGNTLNQTVVYVVFQPTATGTYSWSSTTGIHLTSGTASKVVSATGTTTAVSAVTAVVGLPVAGAADIVPSTNSCTLLECLGYSACGAVTAYGVEYSTTSGFANGTGTAVAGGSYNSGQGAFTESITGLNSGTTYYYHVYVTNSAGTIYSAQGSFTTMTVTYTALSIPSLNFGNQCLNTASSPASFTINVSGLGALSNSWTLNIGTPGGFLVSSSSGGPFNNNVQINMGNGPNYTGTIYVEFDPGSIQTYNTSSLSIGAYLGSNTINFPGLSVSGVGIYTSPTMTASAGSISYSSATITGTLNVGCVSTTSQGVELSTSSFSPGGSGNNMSASNYNSGTGVFSVNLTGLLPGTTYYYDANAGVTTSPSTVYSNVQSFTTLNYALDPGVTGFVNTCSGTQTLMATVKNFGSTTLNSVDIAWTYNSVAQTTVHATGLNIPFGGSANITFGTVTFPSPGSSYTLQATAQNPNGTTASFTGNATYPASPTTFYAPYSGTYTVGTGGYFTTLTQALGYFNGSSFVPGALQNAGICGPVTLSLINSTYSSSTGESFPIVATAIPGTSATNTATIKPASGISPTITGSCPYTLLALVGTSYVTVDGSNTVGGTTNNLTINNTFTSSTGPGELPNGFMFASGNATSLTTNCTLKNCNIIGVQAANGSGVIDCSLNLQGHPGGPTDGANSNNTIQNNIITAVGNGIYINANFDANWNITGNTLGSTSSASQLTGTGIWISTAPTFTISNNTITGVVSSGTGVVAGIDLEGGALGSYIYGNKITTIHQTNSSGYEADGIRLNCQTYGTCYVYNNFVSDVTSYGAGHPTGGGITANYGGYNIDFNTVSLAGSQAGGGYAIAMNAGLSSGSINVRNNIFVCSVSGATSIAIGCTATGSNTIFGTVDYNDYYASGAVGYLGSPTGTLAGWRTESGQDVHSINVSPTFISSTDLDINGGIAGNSGLYQSGTAVSPVTTDIHGTTRNATTPCMGADEFVFGNTWTGTTSTDWNTGSNWSSGQVPTACSTTNTVIPVASVYPVLNTSGLGVGSLIIAQGAQITLNQDLSVCGNWTGGSSSNAVISGTGSLVLSGSSNQLISGKTQFGELRLNNSAGANMQSGSSIDIITSLDLQSGTFTTGTGTLTFKSNSASTVGIIDNFSNGYTGSLSGNIYAERYYNASSTYNQHMMGSPVNAPSLSQFGASGNSGFVTPKSNCDETKLASGSLYGSVFSYHESNGTSCEEAQWKVEGSGNAVNGQGYSVLVSGAGKLTVNGAANLNSSYTVSGLNNSGWSNTSLQGRPYDAGWQLLSNPYLATLVVNPTVNGSSFDGQVQVWNTSTGNYQLTNTVGPFQAFLVHRTSSGAATYTIDASWRSRSGQTFYSANANELTLVATNTTTGLTDEAIVGFNANATDGFDPAFDANKLPGALTRQTMYSVNNGKWMAKNILHDISTTSTVPVGFEPGATGTFTMSFENINSFDPTSYITLEDKSLNIMHDARSGNYTFTADSADGWNRFVLHFTPATQVNTIDASCSSSGTITLQQPGTANWNYTLTDANNAIVTTGVLNQNQPVSLGVAPGTYTLTLTDANNYTAVKSIQVNGPDMISAAFTASNNVVPVQQAVSLTSNVANAVSYNWNFGNGTTATGADASVTYSQPGVYNVSLSVTSQAGCTATKSQNITVTSATGINNITGSGNLNIWSNDNKVYVDFTNLQTVDATVIIYNVLGQEISNDRVTNNFVYQKEVNNISAAYMIVMVKEGDKITTKKVLITNEK